MAGQIEVKVPDIGDFKEVGVIEVLVAPGDRVEKEGSLITVESDKATMEIPSPVAGVVKEIRIKVGDKVAEGSLILVLEQAADAAEASAAKAPADEAKAPVNEAKAPVNEAKTPANEAKTPAKPAPAPDSAPAAAPAAGAQPAQPEATQGARPATSKGAAPATDEVAPATEGALIPQPDPVPAEPQDPTVSKPHASPSIRKFARELGVELARVKGSGPKARVTREDVQAFVKGALTATQAAARLTGGGLPFNLPELPNIDFAKFGPVETRALSRIKKIAGANLHRNWVAIPHVTQFDAADITDLESFRKGNAADTEKKGFKLTMLAFLIKASVTALREFPDFNASLDKAGENIVLKKYFHIGVAVDTPEGLVVPVIRDADRKGVFELARQLAEISKLAKERKLKPGDMQGGSFSISSLGGIGGSAFTPIINAPEVAILGVSRAVMRPVWDGKAFGPRLMLPLSLSYDHRVIDGAAAARFTSYLAAVLSDIRRSLL